MSWGRQQPAGPLNPYNQTTPRNFSVHPLSLPFPPPPTMPHQLKRVPLLPREWHQLVDGRGMVFPPADRRMLTTS